MLCCAGRKGALLNKEKAAELTWERAGELGAFFRRLRVWRSFGMLTAMVLQGFCKYKQSPEVMQPPGGPMSPSPWRHLPTSLSSAAKVRSDSALCNGETRSSSPALFMCFLFLLSRPLSLFLAGGWRILIAPPKSHSKTSKQSEEENEKT